MTTNTQRPAAAASDSIANLRSCSFPDNPQCRSHHLTGTSLLHKSNDPEIRRIGTGFQLHLHILTKGLSFFDLADFGQALNHGNVSEMVATVFTA